MKLVVDENIPFAKESFSRFGDIVLLNGRKISNSICKDSDILIVRSITEVNEELLRGTNVKFVGSATTGADHIDTQYLAEQNIRCYVAAGCNAYSVVEYFFTAITHLAVEHDFSFANKKLGVIGVGKIGSKIAAIGKAFGFIVIKNDPPLQRQTGSSEYHSLEETLNSDIITFHVPMNKTGVDKTYHLIDHEMLCKIKSGTVLVNSSRGGVIDNNALYERLAKYNDLTTVLDVWEYEPSINIDLLEKVNIGTPHVAGYSLEGKVNGTAMVYNDLCNFLNMEPDWKPEFPSIEKQLLTPKTGGSKESIFNNIFNEVYDIKKDNSLLKEAIIMNDEERGIYFDKLRKVYAVRREFDNYTIKLGMPDNDIITQLKALRFSIQ